MQRLTCIFSSSLNLCTRRIRTLFQGIYSEVFSQDLFQLIFRPHSTLPSSRPEMGGGFCLVPQSCLTLCDLMDCSPPVSSVHGISQARILEWVAISWHTVQSHSCQKTHCLQQICYKEFCRVKLSQSLRMRLIKGGKRLHILSTS